MKKANEDWIYDYWEALGDYTKEKREIGVSAQADPNRYKASPELQEKLDYYNTLPKNTGARSAYIKANPEIVEHWKIKNDETNKKESSWGWLQSLGMTGGLVLVQGMVVLTSLRKLLVLLC